MKSEHEEKFKWKRYIAIDMQLMRENNLSFEKWALLENIYFQSNNDYHACFASKPSLAEYLLISRRQIFKIIAELESGGLIAKTELGHLKVTRKWIDLSSETTSAKNALPVQNLHQNSAKIALPPVQKMHPKKDIYKRENKRYINTPLVIPNCSINFPLLQAFIKHREELKRPFTQTAFNYFVSNLETLQSDGHDIEVLITRAMRKGWQDIYLSDQPQRDSKKVKRSKGEELQQFLNEHGYSNIFDAIEDMNTG